MKSKFLSESGSLFRRILNFNKFQITALAFTIVLSLVWYGCTKETSLVSPKTNTIVNNQQKTTMEFIEKAKQLKKNGTIALRDETYYTVAQAIDQLNDALNLNYCRPANRYLSLVTIKDSSNLNLTVSTTISETNLLTVYNNAADAAGDQFYSVSDTTKRPFGFDVRQANNLNGSVLPIHVYFFYTRGIPPSGGSLYPYGEDDDWKYGYNIGKCSDPQNDKDAADIFKADLRKNLLYSNSQPHYFKNRHTICFVPKEGNACGGNEFNTPFDPDQTIQGNNVLNLNDPTIQDNINDYLIFHNYSGYSNYSTCINDAQMNFYYEGMASLVIDNIPNTKVLTNIEVGYNSIYLSYNNVFHVMRADYWVAMTVDIYPNDLPH